LRLVADIERLMLSSCSNNLREIDDFPAPEGEDSTSISPRRETEDGIVEADGVITQSVFLFYVPLSYNRQAG